MIRVVFSAGVLVGAIATLLIEKEDTPVQPLPRVQDKQGDEVIFNLPSHEATRFGFPSTNNLKFREGYVLSYDRRYDDDVAAGNLQSLLHQPCQICH